MTAGLGYALGAMFLYGLADLTYKRAAAAGICAHHFLMVQTWFFSSTVVLYGLATHSLLFNAASLWGAFAGLFAFAGFYNFARSLKTGAVSINAPIYRLSFVLTAVLAVWLLGEPLTWNKLAGLALALIAVWLLLAAPARSQEGAPDMASILRVVIATICIGIANLIYKFGLLGGATPAMVLLTQAAVAVSLATALSAGIDGGIRPSAATWRYSIPAAFALVFAFICLVEGLAVGEVTVMVPIAQLGFVVVAIVGMGLLHEPVTSRKIIGLLAAAAALICLALGQY